MMKSRRLLILAGCLLCAAFLAACGGEDSDSSASGGSGCDPTLDATFNSIQTGIFDNYCTGCHGAGTANMGLRLDGSYSCLIVGKASAEQPALDLIEPFDTVDSYLLMKVRGDVGISGGRMPLGGPYLSAGEITSLVNWVTAGAVTGN